jgi:hypothetical protein
MYCFVILAGLNFFLKRFSNFYLVSNYGDKRAQAFYFSYLIVQMIFSRYLERSPYVFSKYGKKDSGLLIVKVPQDKLSWIVVGKGQPRAPQAV